MSNFTGKISKLTTQLSNPIEYFLPIGEEKIDLKKYFNYEFEIVFNGDIFCINCNKKINKTFMQGYCYPCFLQSPQTSECIFKPHLCRAHIGESRDMKWSEKNCLTTTYVYLSLTSNLKVGVTRSSHIPSRWIDQGAHQAIKLAKCPNRYTAGVIEVEISKHISDRTQWRAMLKGEYDKSINLIIEKKNLSKLITPEYTQYINNNTDILHIAYPGNVKFEKIKSINLHKNSNIKGKFVVIKGQYLIINNDFVFNVRKYTGYTITLNFT